MEATRVASLLFFFCCRVELVGSLWQGSLQGGRRRRRQQCVYENETLSSLLPPPRHQGRLSAIYLRQWILQGPEEEQEEQG